MTRTLIAVSALLLLAACPSKEESGLACTEIGCMDGFLLAFTHAGAWEAGVWTVTAELDDTLVTCETTLPFDGSALGGCDDDSVVMSLSGTELPATQQSIGGLEFGRTDFTTLTVTVLLDGVIWSHQTFTPTWNTVQPNGPGCGPTCSVANGEMAITVDTLAAQRRLWESSAIEDYSFVLAWSCECLSETTGPALIQVAGGAVISATYTSDGLPVSGNFDTRSLDGLFDFLQTAIDQPADAITMEFDPVLGYPTSAFVDYILQAADDEMGLYVTGFVAR